MKNRQPATFQDCVALICAAGEAKAQVVQRAVEDSSAGRRRMGRSGAKVWEFMWVLWKLNGKSIENLWNIYFYGN